MNDSLAAALEWYAKLANTPGWKGQAWHSANALATEHPVLFADLLDLLEQRTGQKRPAAALQQETQPASASSSPSVPSAASTSASTGAPARAVSRRSAAPPRGRSSR